MKLLIDGHNLIGQTPGLSLADPDDEYKIVLLLRRYAARKRGRQVIVVFDHGVYGHPLSLNGYGVTCHFARSPQDADTQLIRRIKQITRPSEWSLVTSDRVVASVAQAHKIRVMDSQRFAGELVAGLRRTPPPADEKRQTPLTAAEIQEWLRIFGIEEDEDEDE